MTAKIAEAPAAPVAPQTTGNAPAESYDEAVDRNSLYLALPAGLIVALLVILLNLGRNPVPFAEDTRSFATVAFLALFPVALITAGAGFVLGVRAWNARVAPERRRGWGWALLPVALAYTLFAAGLAVLLLMLVEFAFRDLQLIRVEAALLVGVGTAAFVLWIAGSAMRLNTRRLLTLIFVILGTGVYLTAITIDDPLWWRVSFSYLGKLESNVNYIFNGTLVFAGLLLLVWRAYFLSDYAIVVRNGLAAPRWAVWLGYALIWLAVGLMIVGLFKSRLNPFGSIMHNLAAYSLAGLFAVLMATTRWTLPGYPREFHWLSLALVVVLLLTLVGRALGLVNTVGLEIMGFALGLIWLAQFARSTESLAARLEPDAFPS